MILLILLWSINVDALSMVPLRHARPASTESTTAIGTSESTLKVPLVLSISIIVLSVATALMISKTSSWATFECTSRLSNKFLHRLLLHQAHGTYITSRDIQHLICQVCRPFVLTADPAAFARHQAEKHGGRHPAPLSRFVPNPTPPTTPASSPPALSRSTTPEKITLVPLATLNRSRPTPTPPMTPTCSFIVQAQPPLPAEGPCLKPIIPPRRPREARKPYCRTHSRAIPTLRDFLRDTCGIELTQRHRLPSPPTSSSSESELTRSGSLSSSPNTNVF